MTVVLRVLNLFFLAMFALSVVVQYNDPDPVQWMAMYGAAAATCILAMYRPLPRWLPILVGAFAALWIAFLLPRVFGQVGLSEMFRETGMATLEIEEGREAIGLLLIVIWMAVLTLAGDRIRRSPARAHSNL